MSLEEKNKAVVRRWVEEVVNGKNLDVADAVLSAELKGSFGVREGYKDLIVYLHKAFPDFHQSIDALIAEGDTVVEKWSNRATHTGGEYHGVPPTGKRYEGPGVDIFRVVDGKIVEQWGVFDRLALFEQLGFALVPPQQATEE
jgi:predicted ester cyclase